ncbi:MAG TPA: alpha/beta hydrolase [Chryseosolibacter sp.]
MKTTSISSKTVIFITGAYVSHRGWASWKTYFDRRGFNTILPSWPEKDGVPKDLREDKNSKVPSVRLNDVIEHYASIIKRLPEKPIAIGHSLGGLISQILLERGLVEAAAVIHSVPPQGIIPFEFSFLKSAWRSLGLFTDTRKPYIMSFETWQYAFANGMSLKEQRSSYNENVIPESKLALRDGLTHVAKVDFNKARGPLLMIAGAKDNIIPATLNRRNFNAYRKNKSITAFKLYADRNHLTLNQAGWEKVADDIIAWLEGVGRINTQIAEREVA